MSSLLARGSTLSLPTSGSFAIGAPPAPAEPARALLSPSFGAAKFTGKDAHRPWIAADLDGYRFFANGFDQPWWWDLGSNAYDMGSTVPTTFSGATQSTAGNWLPDTESRTYRVAYRNSTTGKETAPQEFTVTNSAGADRAVRISDSGSASGEFDQVAIYRALKGTGSFVKVAFVASGSMPYDDETDEDTVRSATPYVRRYRTTKPPVFVGVAAAWGRVLGWTGNDSNLYYGQAARTDGEFVAGDFPSANILQIGPTDGLGEITAVREWYSQILVFKRRAVYAIDGAFGTSPGDHLQLQVRALFTERGCLAPRTIVVADDILLALDERGVIAFDGGGRPVLVGATEETRDSPLESVWARLNRDAARYWHAQLDEENGLVYFHVALDYSPVPNYRVTFNYRENVYVSVDPYFWSHATGYLDDAAGRQHLCRLDFLGFIWEDAVGNTNGVSTGDLVADVSGGDVQTISCSAAAFDTTDTAGLPGARFDRYDSGGDVIETNLVASGTSTSLSPFFWSATAVASSQSVAVGVIPARFRTPLLHFLTTNRKVIARMEVNHEIEASSVDMLFRGRCDDESFARLGTNSGEVALDGSDGVTNVSIEQYGRAWQLEGSQRRAGLDFALLSIDVQARTRKDRA